jgi:hypothetical protein
MRQVRDRERKYLARKTKAGRMKRRLEYQAAKVKRCHGRNVCANSSLVSAEPGPSQGSVLGYGRDGDPRLGLSRFLGGTTDDPKASLGSRPRAPPAS